MKKKLPFSILNESENIDVNFEIHDQVNNVKKISELTEEILNIIDKKTKEESGITEGDIIQSLALVNSIRIGISKFNHLKLANLSNQLCVQGLSDLAKGKKTKIGKC